MLTGNITCCNILRLEAERLTHYGLTPAQHRDGPHLPLQRGLGEDRGRAGPRALGLPLLLAALAAAPQEGPVPIAVATFTVATGQPVVAFWQPTLQRLGAFLERSSPELEPLTRSSFGTIWHRVLARLLLRGCRLLLAFRVLFLAGFWFFLTVSILLRRSWCLFQKQFWILITKALLGFSVLPPPAASPRWLIIGRKTVTGKDLFVQTRRTGWCCNFWFLFTFYWRIRILFFVLTRCRLPHLMLENKTMLVNFQSYLVISPILTF